MESIWSPGTKRLRNGEFPNLEQCVYLWIIDKLSNKISISDSIVVNQAKRFGEQLGISNLEFSYSRGWLEKFKLRFNLRRYTKHGEADKVDLKLIEDEIINIKDEISKYNIDDIVCVESVTEEEIVNLVLNKEKEDVHIDINDNNNIEPLVITHDEVKKSLQTIISFVNNRKHNENELSTINIFNNYMQRLLSNDLVQGTLNFEQKWFKIDFFCK